MKRRNLIKLILLLSMITSCKEDKKKSSSIAENSNQNNSPAEPERPLPTLLEPIIHDPTNKYSFFQFITAASL